MSFSVNSFQDSVQSLLSKESYSFLKSSSSGNYTLDCQTKFVGNVTVKVRSFESLAFEVKVVDGSMEVTIRTYRDGEVFLDDKYKVSDLSALLNHGKGFSFVERPYNPDHYRFVSLCKPEKVLSFLARVLLSAEGVSDMPEGVNYTISIGLDKSLFGRGKYQPYISKCELLN